MNSPEQRAEFLAAYDENLKSGRSNPAPNDNGPSGADPRITASMACLRALHALWRPACSGPVVTPSSQLEGRRFGRFHIERPLGRGAFGEVMLAFDLELRRQVALKISRANSVLSDDGRRRFLRDAQAAARLHHPGIVRVFDAGQNDNRCWIVSEYCRGGSLGK